jgi:uncharacterized protein
MSGQIPEVSFRLDHGFAVRPDLAADKGPGNSVLIGQNSAREEPEAIYIGKLSETPYKNVWLDTRGAHVVYAMGKRRSGKSYTLGVLAEGLVAKSWIKQGTMSPGVLILDTMNVYLTMPFGVDDTYADQNEAVKELRKWQLRSEQLPMVLFRPRGTETPPAVASTEITLRPCDLGMEEWCGLFEVDPFADPLGHLITELHAKVAIDGYTHSSTGQLVTPNPNFVLTDLLSALEFDQDLDRYHRDTRESLRRRLDVLRRVPIFSDAGLDVRQLLRSGQISILLLRELDPTMRTVLVALITKKVMQLRGISEQQERMIPIHLARAEKMAQTDPEASTREQALAAECSERAKEGLPRSWIIIDEAHNYIPARGAAASRRPLKKYVDEGRNLGLSIVVATQQPSGLDPSIQRNADMLLIHALSHRDDIVAAAGMINTDSPAEVIIDSRQKIEGSHTFESLVRNLPLGYALASTDKANRLFPVRIRPRVTVHGGTDY